MGAGLVSACLPISYVLLVHLFDRNGTDRNDPESVKRRFKGALLSNFVSIVVTAFYLRDYTDSPMLEMGVRWDNIGQSITYPFILMNAFYLGQFVMMQIDRTLWHYFDWYEWKLCFNSWVWRRDIIVGPITEEIVFRACSSTLMAHVYGPTMTILLNPIPFAASHFHHIWDDQRRGYSLAHSILQRGFQFCYTYLFGAFATWLQLTTRHAIVPIIAHAFCNAQGLPLWLEIPNYPKRRDRLTLYAAYSVGFAAFVHLLYTRNGMPTP
ncbi:CAAX prenyl protease 2 [Caenorhabditis elegans]|uniref:CAAX prenyl protease 2 n=1 Tax=Caenorhabditis elegans TaxID=6239 RepID=FACE2_CAEEL|nr:CAAX prenyl protease 2 homolog [Caenorhabditis elegans]G5EEP3.1 RecName: Full=CAAX prenyl protease 2 homolog; AltName: Full=Farnesylated proteins-converting enzyme 2; Short=FACE-2 [Caenorhabditis elegans]CAD31791.1 farnesylated-proteins converting enzyme-2 [Caenorhabditis elegans]CAD91634.1 CAAX prenyl protease 2 homolog [Caenorhabditis elegans]|eukprot:NP_001023947.1 CAAX prenyl protease 2 homolog [Caenorhabditis elegans]